MSAPCICARRTVRVALAGCGTVGSEFVRLLRSDAAAIERSHGVRLELTCVLVRTPRKPRPVALPDDLLTDSVDDFLSTPAEVVLEAIGGLEPAGRIARSALDRGARFVTANKALVARLGGELSARHGRLQFEAAVGGGVPIVRVLREALGSARPASVRGILNGTSNFVLTRIEQGLIAEAALAEARQRGLAEADASRDLDGRDAADKIAVLAWLAYGVAPGALPVPRLGLLPDAARLVRDAAAAGGRLRLLAECGAGGDGIHALVAPTVVSAGSAFARTEYEENRIVLDFGWAAPLELAGPGAGGAPTAAALLADVLRHGGRDVHIGDGAAAPPRPAVRERKHRWSLSAAAERAGDLAELLDAAGIGVAVLQRGDGRVLAHTSPALLERMLALRALLAARGAAPALARLELAGGPAGGAA